MPRRAQAQSKAAELQDNLMMNAVTANAQLFINISYQAFLSYEDLWKKANYTDAYIKNHPGTQAFLTPISTQEVRGNFQANS
jgi:hypothetical protein